MYINGLGERAGNAALEEVVMTLKVKKDLIPFHTNVKSEYITKASRLVSSITGFSVQLIKRLLEQLLRMKPEFIKMEC